MDAALSRINQASKPTAGGNPRLLAAFEDMSLQSRLFKFEGEPGVETPPQQEGQAAPVLVLAREELHRVYRSSLSPWVR